MYSEKVLDHFQNPRNVGEIENPDGVGQAGNPKCGDIMKIYLRVENDVITDIRFKTFGCASAIASSSMATELVKGKTVEEAWNLTNKAVAEALDGLPPVKMHCSVLAVDTLRKAIKQYEVEHDLSDADKFSKDSILEELKKVIYPKVGEDIVTLKMVKYVGFDNGIAIVDLDIPSFDPHRDNVVEEIKEHLEKFAEVNDVQVNMQKS